MTPLEKLKALAERANEGCPGPWYFTETIYSSTVRDGNGSVLLNDEVDSMRIILSDGDLKFIPASNPQTVLALIKVIEVYEEALESVKKPTYGTEFTNTDAENLDIISRHFFGAQDKARNALSQAEKLLSEVEV